MNLIGFCGQDDCIYNGNGFCMKRDGITIKPAITGPTCDDYEEDE